MAVGGNPNSVVLVDSLMADLGRISRADGFFSDVKVVKQPDYPPFDEDGDDPLRTVMLEDAPAVLVWVDYEDDTGAGDSSASDQPDLSVYLILLVKQAPVQRTLMKLAADVRIVMRSNMNRSFPDSALENVWGISTRPVGRTFNYQFVRRPNQTTTIGMADSRWTMRYKCPRKTG